MWRKYQGSGATIRLEEMVRPECATVAEGSGNGDRRDGQDGVCHSVRGIGSVNGDGRGGGSIVCHVIQGTGPGNGARRNGWAGIRCGI